MLALKVIAFTLIVPGTVTVGIPYLIVGPPAGQATFDVWGCAALAVIGFGASLYLNCAWHFAVGGQGTPAPIDPPRRLVIGGPYRYVRNPMYVGVLSVLLGESLLFRNTGLAVYAGALWLGVHLWVLLYEEPTLWRKFGEEYAEYCRHVPRWVPRLRAWPGGALTTFPVH